MAQALAANIPAELMNEDFASLLDESLKTNNPLQGSVLKGRVIGLENDFVVIDVGLKSEGRVSKREFTTPGKELELKIGDTVDVFLERLEDREGMVVLSREKARREESWLDLDKAFQKQERVNGIIYSRVKGGFTVDLGGATAFLPGSQVDIRPVKDVGPLMGTPQPFMILKMDRARGNIVVSRRAVLEESRAEARTDLIKGLKEGQILDGVVKNITDYGAFIDLGGVDGLLHVTDISWQRINHPSEALQIGQAVTVQVVRFNQETGRISLGMKQLEADPWQGLVERFPVGLRTTGRVTNITDYGAFVEIESGIEGLVHVSEMSWTKKNVHPGKIVSTSQEVDVQVLDIDMEKRRVSLGIKQTQENANAGIYDDMKKGDTVTCVVSKITDGGIEVTVKDNLEGFIKKAELSRDRAEQRPDRFAVGEKVDAKITNINKSAKKLDLSIKARELDEDKAAIAEYGSSDSGASLGDILGAALAANSKKK